MFSNKKFLLNFQKGILATMATAMLATIMIPGFTGTAHAENDVSSGDVEQEELLPITYDAELYVNGEKADDITVKLKEEGAPAIGFFSLRDGTDLTINRGPQFDYSDYGVSGSSWSTHLYTVSSAGDSTLAYCIQPAEPAGGGSGLSGIEREDLILLSKILYYGYGGNQDMTTGLFGGDENNRYVWTHIMAAYAYRDNDNDFLYGLGINDVDTELPLLANAISTIADMPTPTEADASQTTLTGNTDGSGYVVTEQVQLWGDVEVPAGVEMIDVAEDDVYGNTTVSTDGEIYYFRYSANSAPDSSTITITGGEITTYVVTSAGQQDMAYMIFDENEIELNVTWLTGPTYEGTKLPLKKLGKAVASISGTTGNYTFNYSDTGLSGITFGLYVKTPFTGVDNVSYTANQQVATATTDASGNANFNSVQYSNNSSNGHKTEYYIKEINDKAGYIADNQTTYDVTLTWDAATGTKWSGSAINNNVATITNARQKANVALWKTAANATEDGPSTNYLQGAQYTMYAGENILNSSGQTMIAANTAIQTVTTDATGKAQFTADIPYGYRYYIKETKAPLGYNIDKNLNYSFTWTTNDRANSTVTLPSNSQADRTVYDTQTTVKVSKRDITNSDELPGATLQIVDANGNIIEEWVSTDEDKVVRGLHNTEVDQLVTTSKAGHTIYTLVETRTVDGYTVADKIDFILWKNDVYVWSNNQWVNMANGTVTMYNAPTKVVVSKFDRETNAALPGAVLAIKDSTGAEVDRWTTTTTAHSLEGVLLAGETYKLVEETTVDGYTTAEPIEFTMSATGNTPVNVNMYNATTKLKVTKFDKETDLLLPGATLVLKDSTGREVDRWTTTTDAHSLEGVLLAGETYTLVEEATVAGYTTAEPITFTVPATGDEVVEIDMYNATTKVVITKYDADTQKHLAGATLVLKDSTGKEIDRWITTDEVRTYEKVLLSGETYTLYEEINPKGYSIAAPITFKVPATGDEVVKVDMYDVLTRVEFSKYDADHKDLVDKKQLVGATLILKDSTGKEIDRWVTTEKPHVLEGILLAGATYTLTEFEAPDGYEMAEDIVFTVPADGKLLKVDMYDEEEDDDEGELELREGGLNMRDANLNMREGNLNLKDKTGEAPHTLLYGAFILFLSVGIATVVFYKKKRTTK